MRVSVGGVVGDRRPLALFYRSVSWRLFSSTPPIVTRSG
jgi:hypothetical protein